MLRKPVRGFQQRWRSVLQPSINTRHLAYRTTPHEPKVLHSVAQVSHGSAVGTITVSNPAKLNIVNNQILEQFVDACRALSSDASLRAVVLTGAPAVEGRAAAFIGGADITEMKELGSPEEATAYIRRIHQACQALRALPVPVIARVHGYCLGAGLELMAACDLRIATEQSVFGMPEVKVGIPSVIEAALLPGLIGMGRTRRLLYLAESIPAAEAERWGLVEKVVSSDEAALDEAVNAWIETLGQMGPRAIRIQKRLVQQWENCTLDDGVQAGIRAYSETYADGGREPRQYMDRFTSRNRERVVN